MSNPSVEKLHCSRPIYGNHYDTMLPPTFVLIVCPDPENCTSPLQEGQIGLEQNRIKHLFHVLIFFLLEDVFIAK